jgi:hypothetical protein
MEFNKANTARDENARRWLTSASSLVDDWKSFRRSVTSPDVDPSCPVVDGTTSRRSLSLEECKREAGTTAIDVNQP